MFLSFAGVFVGVSKMFKMFCPFCYIVIVASGLVYSFCGLEPRLEKTKPFP